MRSVSNASLARDFNLIEAVESGNVIGARQCLSDGASPNVRKVVTLTVNTGRWDRTSGPPRTDTSEGESALALAILYGQVDMVSALLEGGSDPNIAIGWQISGLDPWTTENWNKSRWEANWSYPSALALAVGRAGRVTNAEAKPITNWQSDAQSSFKFRINKRGGTPKVVNPSLNADRLLEVSLTPKIEIVTLLIRHGASVSEEILEGTRTLKDRKIHDLLQGHRLGELERQRQRAEEELARRAKEEVARMVESSVELIVSDLRGQLETLEEKLDTQTAHYEHQLKLLHHEIANLKIQLANSTLKQQVIPPTPIKQVRLVRLPYTPREGDEIELDIGQEVFVHLEYVDGWGRGLNVTTGVLGFFPMDCVSETAIGTTTLSVAQRTASLDRPVVNANERSPTPPALPVRPPRIVFSPGRAEVGKR
ncbi:hypothetical protein M427DRAFT_63057 [Gonapodya prolifera JEL478]|uniref:SH3 domain-containing protein n=1 Tax=Gonapodya prolifera (strain JEL478) TaxID=1344416 RepID=A0A138ZZS3_GONPJ|nr:hypothetical protein M427DRAFT_63057 [Gonapodya prolifera JEL478]|eukprot:KXS10004.1 hypothetical protein M427DRAFT_63057 [Gonapodya prolifera JEL478]